METLSFQASTEMKQRILTLAKEYDRSMGYIIRHAIEEHLEEFDDLQEVKAYKSTYNPKHNVSLDDIKRTHGLD